MDKSFEGLLASVLLHLLLLALLVRMPAPPSLSQSEPTEITVLEPAGAKSRRKPVVTETEKKQIDLKNIKDTAEYVSQFTKRVKKEVVARQSGPTRNSQPTVIPLQPKETFAPGRVGGLDTQTRAKADRGVGLPAPGGNQSMHEVAIGPSSIAEFVPGVEVGEFTALNTDQFTYYSFFARINEQVRNRWVAGIRNYVGSLSQKDQAQLARMDRETVIEIMLTSEGEFSSSVLQHSSGDRTLDQTTIGAFRDAAPFLNPPKGMVEADGFVHLRYGFLVRFRPPAFGQSMN